MGKSKGIDKVFNCNLFVVRYCSQIDFAIYMSTLQARLGSGTSSWFFEKPYFNTVTGVLLVMSPGIAWFMTKGILSGIGEAASALTMHADKGVGKVGSKIGV